jgi:calcium permeable stress-gated cation channel
VASLATSLGFTLLIALIFCFLRPYNQVVYAPRLKHADEKHAPPPVGKGVFAWIQPVIKADEQLLVDKVGLDAAVFLRFAKMCRNIFLVATLVGCGILIPVNVIGGRGLYDSYKDIAVLMKMTPQYMFGEIFWAHVTCAYVLDFIIIFFLWRNYRAVTSLRRAHFESLEYQSSLHSRTLMVWRGAQLF